MDDTTNKLGLLIETAETHQQLAEALLQKLQQHTQGLDSVVRQEIRQTLIAELSELHTETQQAVQSLRQVKHTAQMRISRWSVGVALVSLAIASSTVAWSVHRLAATPAQNCSQADGYHR